MSSSLRIIVTGLIAQHPQLGGVTWDYIQYVLGLARLGHDVYYFEDSGEWPYNLDGGPSVDDWIAHDCTKNVNYLAEVMSRFGLENKWAYHFPVKSKWFGLSLKERRNVIQTADLLINVSGTLKSPNDYRQVPRLIYIDSDPGFTQVKLKLPRGQIKFRKRFDAHDIFFSFGECFSESMPAMEHYWRPTRQPIVLSEWRPSRSHRDVFTTVMSWTSYKPLAYQRKTYAQKDVEFKRFLGLPGKVNSSVLEVALGQTQHTKWETDNGELPQEILTLARNKPEWTTRDLLIHSGWHVVDAMSVCSDLDSYRGYIESSKGEWSVAKNGYVVGQPGWFSCRSACYLAAGRPVVVQETGFSKVIPTGEGLFGFNSMEEAISGIREIEGNYARHSKAARAIAEEYFDSDKVLGQLVEEAMNTNICQDAARI